MEHLGIKFEVGNLPELDPEFIPIYNFNQAFLKTAGKPVGIAVEREGGETASVETFIHGTDEMRSADQFYIERLVKTLLWMKGGSRVYVRGDDEIAVYIESLYCRGGLRSFDRDKMAELFEHPFETVCTDKLPEDRALPGTAGGHLDGCRIGLDAGGSSIKVSALIDGDIVFSEGRMWFPELNSDPEYHYNEIVSALKAAAEHLPRVDAVGISSAGVFVNDRTMGASLFIKVPRDLFEKKVKDIYIRAVSDTFGSIPLSVTNDGDVSSLAGAICLDDSSVLGISMGTSEAGGFIDGEGRITGWLNELAFMPVDVNPCAARDEWSGDIGCGVKYFSKDAVIRLAPKAGIELDEALSDLEKLKCVQRLMTDGDERAAAVFRSIGVYLAHTLVYYRQLYGFRNVLLLGGVISGKGGDILLGSCRKVLEDEYPETSSAINIVLPDEKLRRLGQSAAAASLPE